MQSVELIISNEVGLHARPAALFVQTANKFKARISISKDGQKVNAKSIIAVLSLGAAKGSRVVIEAAGEDEGQAIDALKKLVEAGFGET